MTICPNCGGDGRVPITSPRNPADVLFMGCTRCGGDGTVDPNAPENFELRPVPEEDK